MESIIYKQRFGDVIVFTENEDGVIYVQATNKKKNLSQTLEIPLAGVTNPEGLRAKVAMIKWLLVEALQ